MYCLIKKRKDLKKRLKENKRKKEKERQVKERKRKRESLFLILIQFNSNLIHF